MAQDPPQPQIHIMHVTIEASNSGKILVGKLISTSFLHMISCSVGKNAHSQLAVKCIFIYTVILPLAIETYTLATHRNLQQS